MTPTLDMTIRDIVAADFRAAAVFQRHGIDFCCKGNRSVEEACRACSTSAEDVLREVAEATASSSAGGPRFNSWDLGMLVSYIVSNHHAFVRRAMPALLAHTRKVAAVHGEQHPELREVAGLFERVADEMTSHMGKEEQILFPYMVALAGAAAESATAPSAPFGTVRNPIRMMEAEHESAGDAMARIRELTCGYAVPAGACTTYRVCLQELEEFERDLHEHVHLENNILFPRATRIEAEIGSRMMSSPSCADERHR
jgi:regulator of cell morphogenesis and NO signaling